MTEAILKDKKKILPCAVPGRRVRHKQTVRRRTCQARRAWMEQIIEINLTKEERIALQKSASAVQELVDVLGV